MNFNKFAFIRTSLIFKLSKLVSYVHGTAELAQRYLGKSSTGKLKFEYIVSYRYRLISELNVVQHYRPFFTSIADKRRFCFDDINIFFSTFNLLL